MGEEQFCSTGCKLFFFSVKVKIARISSVCREKILKAMSEAEKVILESQQLHIKGTFHLEVELKKVFF
ncbi:hypothetical protein [Paenibacillus sp. Leaf72]|uniref:hypothetical protein n=1 Tax=Paenibacillus sp. Leaf72 TaxID=1736234 RepID=UPI0006F215B8|nr:hypothetical protein [Paenibacillus sp. Leaf72]KQO08494.1 hypothetical protein ASF12_32320 [Paenibacillus sp. Leaf72]